jgi:hypothetical protein
MATPVGLDPTVTGDPAICVLVATLMILTLFDPVFATTARPNTGSIAIADGLVPTPIEALGAVGNAVGSTPMFTAEIAGFGGTTSVFFTTIG